MVKRTPPLTLALIGTGESSTKNVEALLNDYTSTYTEVTFILPVDDAHWTPTLEAAADWASANDIPYVAVTDGTSGKKLAGALEKADSTVKVSRVSTKMVQLLEQEAGEGHDVAVLVAWDDDDNECATAVNKALAADIKAMNLCDGLDPFEFDDDDTAGDDEAPTSHAHGLPDDAGDTQPADDDYDSWGIRKLRGELRETKGHGLTDRQIGQLEKDDAIKALRGLDKGATEPEEADEAQQVTSTTRARRAFAEGAAEGSGETKALPRSKGSDILEDEDDEGLLNNPDLGVNKAGWDGDQAAFGETVYGTVTLGGYDEATTRARALELAISSGSKGADAIAEAMKYETYLKGARQSAGRPRADGTPAQRREINEDGKPVRRRRASSTD